MGDLCCICQEGDFACVYSALGAEFRRSKGENLHDIQYGKGIRCLI